ncbi:MAG TPA: hypothetical protein DD490_14915, partial [Acidobacteria bacterium]|nr:hypothetical protein [Acidobacteriota bacterium]
DLAITKTTALTIATPGGTVTFQAVATLSPAATGSLVNTATVAPAAGITDPAAGNNSEGDTDTLVPRADLAITKTTALTIATPGEPVTYTLTVTNLGPSNATGLTVLDTVPTTLQNPSWTCVASTGSSCAAGGSGNLNTTANLAAGGTLTYTLTATLAKTATGTLTNTASVTAPAGTTDPQAGNNSAAATLPIALRSFDLYTVVPCRLLDTRNAAGPFGGPALTSGVPRTFQATGSCGVPATAKAIAVNITVIAPPAAGFLRVYPDGDPIPNATTINFSAGQILSNNAILPLGPTGGIQVLSTLFPSGNAVHVAVDVMGYFD